MVAFLERLQSGHKVVSSCDTRSDDTLRNTSSDCTLNNGRHGVHRPDDLVLELRRYMQLDLLEQVF